MQMLRRMVKFAITKSAMWLAEAISAAALRRMAQSC